MIMDRNNMEGFSEEYQDRADIALLPIENMLAK